MSKQNDVFLGQMACLARELEWLEERFTYWGDLSAAEQARAATDVNRTAVTLETLRLAQACGA